MATRADAIAASWHRDGVFQGCVLVQADRTPVLRKCYGFANVEWEIANTPDTRFRLGSITKQFTAAAVMQLVDQGKVKLEDPVSKYYPTAPAAWDKITVHHLLNHTSGIPSYTSQRDFFPKQSRDARTPAQVVQLTQDMPLEFAPGEKWNYNNTGYILLGIVIEKASGMKYAEYVRKNLMEPAGMTESGYDMAGDIIKKRADGYEPDGQNAAYLDMTLPHAAGSLYSSIDDLAKWDRALYGGKIVSAASLAKMTTPGQQDYGYGLWIKKRGEHTAVGHGGGINGFSTNMLRIADRGVLVVVLSNKQGPAPNLAEDLVKLTVGEAVAPRPLLTEVSLTPEQLQRFAGKYVLPDKALLQLLVEDRKLVLVDPGQRRFPLMALSATEAYLKIIDARFELELNGEGKAVALVEKRGGRSTRIERQPD